MNLPMNLSVALITVLFFSFGCNEDENPPTPIDIWTISEARLSQSRAAAGFAELPNGNLIIIGGRTGDEILGTTEIYEIKRHEISPGANLKIPRSMPVCLTLNDGKILVTGGLDAHGNVLKSCELYDPLTNTFMLTDSMNAARARHKANLLPDGKILATGGASVLNIANDPSATLNATQKSAEIYDPNTQTWSITADMAIPRVTHATATLPNGDILITGGLTPAGMFPSMATNCEIYKAEDGIFEPAADMPEGRAEHTLTELTDGRILASGGGSLQTVPAFDIAALTTSALYDASTNSWTSAGNMNIGRAGHLSFVFSDGKVLVPGGDSGSLLTLTPTHICELFDPNSETWTVTDTLRSALVGYAGILTEMNQVIIAGGTDGTTELNEVYLMTR